MNTRTEGSLGEAEAYRAIVEMGMLPLCKNYKRSTGEIDLIAQDGDTIVFIEVKARRTLKMGLPAEAVTPAKQKRIIKTALMYMKEHRLTDARMRFDVIAILDGDIKYIRSAFMASSAF